MPSPNQTLNRNLTSNIRAHGLFLAVAGVLALQGCDVSAAPALTTTNAAVPHIAAATQIEAGRYMVKVGGCNDCHTPGYVESNGAAPAEADWLTGSPVGYAGPWGVSYPANLRLSFQSMSEAEFLDLAHRGEGRPPMPWPSLKTMSDEDLKAIYAYIHALGPKGEMMPAALSPGVAPDRMYFSFMPIQPK
jgi:mono/diheme cytochrome c family protein